MRLSLAWALAVLTVALAGSCPARACGFADQLGNLHTFRRDIAGSKVILYGRLENARPGPANSTTDLGSTDLVILSVLKADPALGNPRKVSLPYYLPPDGPKVPSHMVVFADVSGGKVHPTAGTRVTPALLDYLKGLVDIGVKDRVKLLRYCFDYLDHADKEVAKDAYAEFVTSPDPDIWQAGKQASAEKLRRWLQDPRTTPERLRLYGFLLGSCGGEQDAALLRRLLEKLTRQEQPPQVDAILTGYTLLKPREGWDYVLSLVKDPSTPFMRRYSGFRAIRFFSRVRPNVVGKKDRLQALSILIGQGDMADLPIDDLRRQRCWDLTDQILALHGKRSHETPFIQRTILRYALQCPDDRARRLVADVRRQDPGLISDVEEALKPEAEP
jgi:hypothetical protein